MQKIFLVRHGSYDYNTGQLNEVGREQSRQALCELVALGAGNVTLILSSDAPRALETSEIIAEGLSAQVAPSKRMRLSALDPSAVQSLDSCISRCLQETGMTSQKQLVVVAHEPLLQVAVYQQCKGSTPHLDNGAVLKYQPGTWVNSGFIDIFADLLEDQLRS